MKIRSRHITLLFVIAALTGTLFSLYAGYSYAPREVAESLSVNETEQERQTEAQPDTTAPPRYPIAPVIPETYEELTANPPIDFRQPTNLNDGFVYNPLTNRYELQNKIGEVNVIAPIALTQEEYLKYSLERSMSSYWRKKNDDEALAEGATDKKDNEVLDGFDFNFDLGPAEKLFGPGGVRLQANGSALIKMGVLNNKTQNPTMTERQRNKTTFDFDTQIQTKITASVGDKINFDLNYNTESTFDFDTKKLKLGYVGKEDEIIKVLEAGNVSMNTTNSLIQGGAALFGVKTELQFGKLTVGAVFSQQESQSRTTKSKGNTQTTPFEIAVDTYEENMHYFLSLYFREGYDKWMSTLPLIRSGITIDKVEVWVTNKRSNYDQSRNIVAFADLGEYKEEHIGNDNLVQANGGQRHPSNGANNLYSTIANGYPGARDKSSVNEVLTAAGYISSMDFEKIENARKLDANEYTLNPNLGYISLRTKLQTDEVLAVAYQYTTSDGTTYQVGEFSTDKTTDNTTDNLYLKLVKGTNTAPSSYVWDLMMRNVYSITGTSRSLERENFMLDIKYLSDTTGVYLNFINAENISGKTLLSVMNLDRLNSNQEAYPDGFFDYIEGKTVNSTQGKIIFPVVEPFGSHLANAIGDPEIAQNYIFQELYDSTLTYARQLAEKNKFILTGEYKGSGSSAINVGYNTTRGSVAVYADGVLLKENSDYTINYTTGDITVTNPAYVNSNITTRSESNNSFGMQRKTMMGLNLSYAFSPKFNVGATIMNLSEMPMTLKNNLGEESINNTIFGFNTNYSSQSYWLTHMLDKIPLLDLTAPSQITFSAEYAQLIPGHYKSEYGGDYSYIDDFENAETPIDLRSPYAWKLAATPSAFREHSATNNINYGKNRALLAWYNIDVLFTRKSSLTPTHIKNDLDQLSNHYVREIYESELFPNKDAVYNESSTIPVLNLAYYPKERGPYNLDYQGMNADGTLSNPEERWGGIYRRIESGNTDFEAQNIETIEFWLMDPYIYEPNSTNKGKLYIQLGEVSEDILKDGKKFFENGMPIDGDTTKLERTAWGYVPTVQSLTYAFDNSAGSRKRQDVGLNGLTTEQEFEFDVYAEYVRELRSKLSPDIIALWERDQFSPLNDPAGDNYHYYRGSDYDRDQVSILDRYKHFNGTEGNSLDTDDSPESYATAAQLTPDVEDINQDNTLNESERYFEYEVEIDPNQLEVGRNYIVDKRTVSPTLKNKTSDPITWYQFKIPVSEFSDKIGDINLSNIRFVRTYLTEFSDTVVLRFGTLQLVRGDWRTYTKDLNDPNVPPQGDASLSLSTVNIEENGDRTPVNYIMPPGVNRMVDPGQPQIRRQNEQSLSMTISNLSTGDARAVYKGSGLDTRQYKRLQMFVHAEALPEDVTNLQDNDLAVFLRLGSDYKDNYYEYEIPLKVTQPGKYDSNSTTEREAVWPVSNMFDFPFELLTNLKLSRNKAKRQTDSEVNFYTQYSEIDPNKPMNTISIKGNPSLSNVKVVMIGVRNKSNEIKSAEVWVDELRLTEFNEDGGWAANVNLYVGLSDLGSINFSGKRETTGFGTLDQGLMDRNMDDYESITFQAQVELGKFFPEKAKVSIPVYYSYNKEQYDPKYSPLDQDILLEDALESMDTQHEKDSIISMARDKVTQKSLNINNVRVNITSKTPMPYDPSNFTIGYSTTERSLQNATTEYERETNQRLLFSYSYSPMLKPWEPFKNLGKPKEEQAQAGGGRKQSQGRTAARGGQASGNKFFQEIGIGLLPKSLSVNSDITRNYYERQLRNVSGSEGIKLPVSFREDFFWNRSLNLQWDLTKNLNINLTTGTEATIDTPHEQVNKKLNMTAYEHWKDSVNRNIQNWGRPMAYDQRFNASYNIPFRNIPILNFITASLTYSADYGWVRGAEVDDGEGGNLEIGNTIRNTRNWGINNVSLNLLNLYNKSKFLDETNKKFTLKAPTQGNSNNRNQNRQERDEKAAREKLKKKYEGEVTLLPDTTIVLSHALDNKRIRVSARTEEGKLYDLKYKRKDANTIEIKSNDTLKLKVTVTQLPPQTDAWWYKPAQYVTRGLMMVRKVDFSYNQTSGLTIPGYKPEVGDFFGQKNSSTGLMPGLGFAFGLSDSGLIEELLSDDLLVNSGDVTSPAIYNKQETFNASSLLEPIVGMKINLNASWSKSENNQDYYMYTTGRKRMTGNFTMTTIGLQGIFDGRDAGKGYSSKAFDKFLNNRAIVQERLERQYAAAPRPGNVTTALPVDINSTDVLIPSFLAAYTGKDASSNSMAIMPSLFKLLPNWKVSYEGLIQVPIIQKHFKSFVLEHAYTGSYSVGSFSSLANWIGIDGTDNMGYSQSLDGGVFVPSSPYDIASVSIAEKLDPLLKVTSTFFNNMSINFNYFIRRSVSLNISSYQIVETDDRGWTIGTGYRFENFNKVLKMPKTGGNNFNNECRIQADVSFSNKQNLIRKIETGDTQATQGDSQMTIKFTADYNVSRMLTFQAYFDRQMSNPLVSTSSYPYTKTSFGISFRINFSR